jgi:cyclin-dependent kinase regulatory subunit CKS1
MTITYSDRYSDDIYEYRHVILDEIAFKKLPTPYRLFSETELRNIGVQQSKGWIHYDVYHPEPYVLLFRRKKI